MFADWYDEVSAEAGELLTLCSAAKYLGVKLDDAQRGVRTKELPACIEPISGTIFIPLRVCRRIVADARSAAQLARQKQLSLFDEGREKKILKSRGLGVDVG